MKNSTRVETSAFETLTDDEASRVTGGCEPFSAVLLGLGIGVAYGIWYFTKGPGSNPSPAPTPKLNRQDIKDFTLPELK